MSSFLDRSNYLKKVAGYNKKIANGLTIDGGVRKSFFRVNDEEELLSACINWGHFPCLVHIGHVGVFRDDKIGTPKNVLGTHLYFLSRLDLVTYPEKDNAIEMAYDESFGVMLEFLSFMKEDQEEHGAEGYLYDFNLGGAKYDMLSGIIGSLYGWYLVLEDKTPESGLIFNSDKWYKGVNDETL